MSPLCYSVFPNACPHLNAHQTEPYLWHTSSSRATPPNCPQTVPARDQASRHMHLGSHSPSNYCTWWLLNVSRPSFLAFRISAQNSADSRIYASSNVACFNSCCFSYFSWCFTLGNLWYVYSNFSLNWICLEVHPRVLSSGFGKVLAVISLDVLQA